RAAQSGSQQEQRTRQRETHRTCLSGETTAVDVYFDVEATLLLRCDQRLLHMLLVREPRKIIIQQTAVHAPRTAARCQPHTRDARLAPANAMKLVCHLRSPERRAAAPRVGATVLRTLSASSASGDR